MGEVTTVGKLLLKSSIPSDLRSYVDETSLDAKGLGTFFDKLSQKDPEVYKKTVTDLARLGFEVSTRQGSSVGLSDLLSPIDKDKRFKELDVDLEKIQKSNDSQSEKNDKVGKTYEDFINSLNKEILDEGLRTNKTLAKVILSGSRGSPTQYRQTVAAPVLVNDVKGRPMFDFPIKHSFAEGLTLPEYLAHSYGTRQGTVSTKLSVADAGYFSKQLSRATMTIIVEEQDCGTDNGIEVSVDDKDSIGAYLAKSTNGYNKNNEITGKMLNDLKNKNVKTIIVRSPITCQSSRKFHPGAVCQFCVGKRERHALPQLGDYVGITASTALGERLSQGTLNVKHTSSSSQKVVQTGGFKLINQLANIPKSFQNKAALASHDGEVTDIRAAPQGGYYIDIGKNEYYIPTGLALKVKKGDKVEAGDQLSDGIINPAEVVKLKGIGEGRKYFTEIMHKTFKEEGMPINRRNFELISKAAVDHVKIINPEGLGDYLPDQVVSYQAVEKNYRPRTDSKNVRIDQAYNKFLEQPVLHYTIGTRITHRIIDNLKKNNIENVIVNDRSVGFVPEMQRLLDIPAYEQDWMHQLYSTYLQKRFIDAINSGAESNITGPSPVPGIAYGVGFGSGRKTEKIAEVINMYATENTLLKDGSVGGEYGCLMAVLDPTDAKPIISWTQDKISTEDLAEDGIEHSPHVTVLYGFHEDFDYTDLNSSFEDFQSISFTLGPISRFENKEKGFDVLKVDVESDDLRKMNKIVMSKFKDDITTNYPDYKPHLTLAYVKPGTCKELDGQAAFEDNTYVLKYLVYSLPASQYKVDVVIGKANIKKAEASDPWLAYDAKKNTGVTLSPEDINIVHQLKEKSAEELAMILEYLNNKKAVKENI